MVEIKTNISFDEYSAIINKVTNDCFPDGTYSPTNYELSFRTALLLAFAPDYDLNNCGDNNALWERVTNDESRELLAFIKQNSIYYCLEREIRNAIDYRIKILSSGSMSMSDLALSKLFEVLTEKVEQIDTSMLTKENMDTMIKAVNATQDGNFAESLVDIMLDKGLLAKPNRETRRANKKATKTAKITKMDIQTESNESESDE